MLNVTLKPTDLAILWKNQASDVDARVPTPEEMAATEFLLRSHLSASRAGVRPDGWLERPSLQITGQDVIAGNLRPWVANHPALAPIPQLTIPLPTVSGEVNRRDWVYLLAFSVVVGVAEDPDVALEFAWRDGAVLQTLTRENTARIRDGWAVVVCPGGLESPLTVEQVAAAIGNTITISRQRVVLTVAGQIAYLWGLDGSLAEGSYAIVETMNLLPLCRVWRRVTTGNPTGYIPSLAGQERPLETAIHLEPTYRYVGDGWDNWPLRAKESLYRLMQGQPLQNSPQQQRWVYNLINGQVGANPDAPGLATLSLSGDLILANGQRWEFSNRATTTTVWGSWQALVDSGGDTTGTVTLAANSPTGTIFATTGHKIYSATGTDITSEGTFTGAGTAGPLTWTTGGSASVTVGDFVWIIPAIQYPAGAGFPLSGRLEAVYLNASIVPAANVQHTPLTAYRQAEFPNGYIVAANSATGGIQLYKAETLTTDGSGRVSAPGSGLIAFLSGPGAPTGAVNRPVATGLTANTAYQALCYYLPTAGDQWQTQWLTPQYAGQRRTDWLEGATLTTPWLAVAHRLGGQVGGGDGLLSHALALRLPRRAVEATPSYQLGTADLPQLGLVAEVLAGGHQPALPGGRLEISAQVAEPLRLVGELTVNNIPLNAAKPTIAGGDYQLVLACGIRRVDGAFAMVVAAINGRNGDIVNLNDAVAFDVFELW